jgi:molecular chaperone HtpG
MATPETFAFQSDINQLLSLIINTFYSNKEVFLRELISNASDALDKIRYLSLTNKTVLDGKPELEITIRADKENNKLIISDSGIGMTKDDLVNNLGVIARSGTKEFIEKLTSKNEDAISLIGQFGCGAYSAFLVADTVSVISKHNDDDQYIWESNAGGTFTIAKDTANPSLVRGTSIVLHLKDDQKEFLEEGKIRDIIKAHSEFISYPIKLEVEREVPEEIKEEEKKEKKEDEEGEEGKVEEEKEEENKPLPKMIKKKEFEILNTHKPLWMRKPDDITKEEYVQFYKAISGDWADHQSVKHFSVEGQLEFTSLLFLPSNVPFDMFEQQKTVKNIRLYVKRVFIMDDCVDIIPEYLNFIKGVVDSDDLPLNISRETLQQNRILKVIKKNIVKKCLEMFADLADDTEEYNKFWNNYSRNIKWGIHSDETNKPKLLELLRFNSTASSELTSLKDYVSRMKEGQKYIYYITGDDQKILENSPFLEALKKRKYEVLFMTESIDEYMLQTLREYDGKQLKCAIKDDLDLDMTEDQKKEIEELKKDNETLCAKIKEILGDKVTKVQVSDHIVDTPCILVADQYGLTPTMEKILKAQALRNPMQNQMKSSKIMEINVNHRIIKKIKDSLSDEDSSSIKRTNDLVTLLFDTAVVSSGYTLEDPSLFAKRIHNIIQVGLDIDETEEENEVNDVANALNNIDLAQGDTEESVAMEEVD